MFSNLASYIFGGSSDEPVDNGLDNPSQQPKTALQRTPEDEWVVVGGEVQPALTLGSLDDVAPRPSTGSTGSSEAPSEMGNEDDMVIVENGDPTLQQDAAAGLPPSGPREIALTRSARRLTSPLSCPNGMTLPQIKALRSSQKSKQKEAGKHLTPKGTERHNKAVKIRSNHQSKRSKAASLAVKTAGFNLKQC